MKSHLKIQGFCHFDSLEDDRGRTRWSTHDEKVSRTVHWARFFSPRIYASVAVTGPVVYPWTMHEPSSCPFLSTISRHSRGSPSHSDTL